MSLCAVTPTYLAANALGPATTPAAGPRGPFARLFCGIEPPVYQAGSPPGGYTTSGGAGLPAGTGTSSSTPPPPSSGPKSPPFVPVPEPVLVVGNEVWTAVWQDLERMPRITLVRND